MKKIKQLFYIIFFFSLASCGFSPMLKDVNLNDIKINKIDYSGPGELTYYLKSNFNMPINQGLKDAYSLKINIAENSSSVTKDTAGITTEEMLNISINFEILNNQGALIGLDSISDGRTIRITNNVSTDNEVKRIEKENIITNLIQQLTFAIRAKIISSQQ